MPADYLDDLEEAVDMAHDLIDSGSEFDMYEAGMIISSQYDSLSRLDGEKIFVQSDLGRDLEQIKEELSADSLFSRAVKSIKDLSYEAEMLSLYRPKI